MGNACTSAPKTKEDSDGPETADDTRSHINKSGKENKALLVNGIGDLKVQQLVVSDAPGDEQAAGTSAADKVYSYIIHKCCISLSSSYPSSCTTNFIHSPPNNISIVLSTKATA